MSKARGHVQGPGSGLEFILFRTNWWDSLGSNSFRGNSPRFRLTLKAKPANVRPCHPIRRNQARSRPATAPGMVSVQADTQHGFQASNHLIRYMPQTNYPSSPRRRGSSCYLVSTAVNGIPAFAGMTVFPTLRQVSNQVKSARRPEDTCVTSYEFDSDRSTRRINPMQELTGSTPKAIDLTLRYFSVNADVLRPV